MIVFCQCHKSESASAVATPPVTEVAVSSTVLSNVTHSVSDYTARILGSMIHDCVKWVFTGQ